NRDSLIYVLKVHETVDVEDEKDPFAVGAVKWFFPNHVTLRITAQSGLFTIHPKPAKPDEDSDVDHLIIPGERRREIKRDLYKFGIHRATLFPGLDGLARHIEWTENRFALSMPGSNQAK